MQEFPCRRTGRDLGSDYAYASYPAFCRGRFPENGGSRVFYWADLSAIDFWCDMLTG